MDAVFKKMNFKEGHKQIVVLNSPDSFQVNLEAMQGLVTILLNHDQADSITYFLAFVTQKAQIDALVPEIAPKLAGDAMMWFAYPKGTSKNYSCDFNRDTGWAIMGSHDLEPVRMVAIDADWSALRFRKVEYIKKLTRRESMALSKTAKERTSQKGK